MTSKVCIIKRDVYDYPNCRQKGYRPAVAYPEYLFPRDLSEQNQIYDMVREGLARMQYDKENYGTADWNPLGEFVKPGDFVVIKPNMVMDVNSSGAGTDCLYTHPSVVAAVVDYVLIALKGKGKIIIGDAPMQSCRFEHLVRESGYSNLLEYYKEKDLNETEVLLEDFRELVSKSEYGVRRYTLNDQESIVVDLRENSEFARESQYFYDHMRITNYDPNLLQEHHKVDRHEYCVNKRILEADVIINIPKPKTHRKAGVTVALKNMVGISARKEYLPHHTNGSLAEGGDEYLDRSKLKACRSYLEDRINCLSQTRHAYKRAFIFKIIVHIFKFLLGFTKENYYEGSWYGNDTIGKTIVDLNKILFYSDKTGILHSSIQRKYFIVADMIIAGEKEGPIAPTSKELGVIAIGENPVCFDEIIGTLMGAKIEYIKTFWHARNPIGKYVLVNSDVTGYLVSNDERYNNKKIAEVKKEDKWYFRPTNGWQEGFYEKQ